MTVIKREVMLGAVTLATMLTMTLQAQTTTTKEEGAPSVTTAQITGVVQYIEGHKLVAKILPDGEIREFNIPPSQQFVIDGQTKLVGDLKPGTVLTATATTTTQPVTVRTTAVLDATVWYASGNTVILTLEDGQNRTYTVPDSYRFVVEGKPASVRELRKGMKVTATKVTAEPTVEISSAAVIKGVAP